MTVPSVLWPRKGTDCCSARVLVFCIPLRSFLVLAFDSVLPTAKRGYTLPLGRAIQARYLVAVFSVWTMYAGASVLHHPYTDSDRSRGMYDGQPILTQARASVSSSRISPTISSLRRSSLRMSLHLFKTSRNVVSAPTSKRPVRVAETQTVPPLHQQTQLSIWTVHQRVHRSHLRRPRIAATRPLCRGRSWSVSISPS